MTMLMDCDNYKVFVNTYKPRTDYTIELNDYTGSASEKSKIMADVLDLLSAGKNVVVSSTSFTFAEALKKAFKGL
jgi:hypothetical protein